MPGGALPTALPSRWLAAGGGPGLAPCAFCPPALFSGAAAATVSAPSPDRRMFHVSLSFPFSTHLGSTSLSEPKGEKFSKTFPYGLNALHLGSPGSFRPGSWQPGELPVSPEALLLACHTHFPPTGERGLRLPQAREQFQTLMEPCAD